MKYPLHHCTTGLLNPGHLRPPHAPTYSEIPMNTAAPCAETASETHARRANFTFHTAFLFTGHLPNQLHRIFDARRPEGMEQQLEAAWRTCMANGLTWDQAIPLCWHSARLESIPGLVQWFLDTLQDITGAPIPALDAIFFLTVEGGAPPSDAA